jgi:hypothetical protein
LAGPSTHPGTIGRFVCSSSTKTHFGRDLDRFLIRNLNITI